MSVRGNNQVRNEFGITLMAVNLRKLVAQSVLSILKSTKNELEILKLRFPTHFSYFSGLLSQPHHVKCYRIIDKSYRMKHA
ncbi:hypothetical protein GCM10007273_03000 [Jeotgalicoccus aerolatus]|nr:hypothetical protein GCM10007273_03000 [Jeotgalicoccus aerolatus]